MKQHFDCWIFQVIPWEKRNHYFSYDWGDEEMDMLYVGSSKDYGMKWHDGFCFGFIKELFGLKRTLPPYKDFSVVHGLPMVIKRPHSFKLDDKVKLTIEIKNDS